MRRLAAPVFKKQFIKQYIMSTTLTIHITKEVLEESKNCSGAKGRTCAVAVAIRHIWPKAYVCTDEAYLNGKWYKDVAKLPLMAQNFIDGFDRSTPEVRIAMEPISFNIVVPDEVINQINIDEVLKLANTVTRKEVLV